MKLIYKTLGLALALSITGCSKMRTLCDHEYDSPYFCCDRTCLKCGQVSKASRSHTFEDDFGCHDRTCIKCGTVVEGTGHVYECIESANALISEGELDLTEKARFYKSCKFCGDLNDETFDSDSLRVSYSTNIQKAIAETKRTLKFDENGNFKILVIADSQFPTTSIDERTISLVKALIKQEKPDFVMMPGDTSSEPNSSTFRSYLTQLVSAMEDNQIPWANTFGNHDYGDRESWSYSADSQMNVYNTFSYCLSRNDNDSTIDGCSNYNLPILSSDGKHVAYQLWALDTRNNGLSSTQRDWYVNTSKAMKKENGGKLINSMMFFHIPLPQMNNIYNQRNNEGFIGHAGEVPNTAAGNTDMFGALKEVGDVRLLVNSHDHKNDFIGTYDGIDMCYSSSVGYQYYRDENMMGARVINLNEDDLSTYETHMVYAKDLTHNLITTDVTTNLNDLNNNKEDILDAETDLTTGQYRLKYWDYDGYTLPTFGIEEGKGYNNSKAYKVTPQASSYYSLNTELRLHFPSNRTPGSNNYLRVWMDMPNIDFRKASWGVIDSEGFAYTTDNIDRRTPGIPMYMLFDGESDWKINRLNWDGCFGADPDDNNYSLKNFKGFMAFNLNDLRSESGYYLNSYTTIKGVFFYFDVMYNTRNGSPFYIDRIALCNQYNVFSN